MRERLAPPAGLAAACAPVLCLLAAASPARGQTEDAGVHADSVVFGQSAAFTGPAAQLGLNMRLGIRAAFEEANRNGGVHGRQLRLVARDDGYEPEAAATNTRALIELGACAPPAASGDCPDAQSGVFALIGAVGTPTSTSAEPVASSESVPYIGAFTGAEFLRSEERPFVVNLRASYWQETAEMVARLTRDLGVRRIAVFHQNDSYGAAGLTGVARATEARGMEIAAIESYMRNTRAVKRPLLDLREQNPEAVIIIGAYEPVAEFIKWSRRIGFAPVFVNISFVGSNALLNELGPAGNGVVVTQVVPFPRDTSVPVVRQYHAALRAVEPGASPGFVSLEGYLAGRLAVEGLERAGPSPTREGFLHALNTAGPIDLGGFVLEYGEGDNQGSDRVFLTVIRNGRFVPMTRLSR